MAADKECQQGIQLSCSVEWVLTFIKAGVKQAKDCDCITQVRECGTAICAIKGSVPRAQLVEFIEINW